MTSDDATHGWFIAVQYRSNRGAIERLRYLPAQVALVATKTGKKLRYNTVDARRPLSASKIENDGALELNGDSA